MSETKTKPYDTHMSPEGLEEAVQFQTTFRMTLTQGGKYRLYVSGTPDKQFHAFPDCFDDKAAAIKALGQRMTLFGAMTADPRATLDILTKGLRDE